MKSEPDLTLKKVKPRPNSVNFDILRASRQLFGEKYSQLISSDTFVINLDDTLINRNIKIFFSWSKKVYPEEAKNTHHLLDLLTEKLSYYEMETGFQCFQAQLQTLINLIHFWINLIFGFQKIKYLKRKKFLFYKTIEANTKQSKFYKNLKK